MNKALKLLLILIIFFLIIIDYKSLAEVKLKTDSDIKNTDTNAPMTGSTNLDEAENLIYTFQTIGTVDSNDDLSFDTLYGDKEINNTDLTKDYGLKIGLEVYDSNGNDTLEVGETTHAKFYIKNTSDKDYTIQNINIVGQSSTFNDGDFTNLNTTNAGDLDYKFEGLTLTYPKDKGFILAPNIEASFEFDIFWNDDEKLNNINKLTDLNTALPFIGIDFIATSNDTSLYIELRDEQFKFSGESFTDSNS